MRGFAGREWSKRASSAHFINGPQLGIREEPPDRALSPLPFGLPGEPGPENVLDRSFWQASNPHVTELGHRTEADCRVRGIARVTPKNTMSFLSKLFGGSKTRPDHGVRFAQVVKAREAKIGDPIRAYNEIAHEFSTQFSYFSYCPGKGDQIKTTVSEPVEQIMSNHHGTKQGRISADNESISFGFFAVCVDDDEVQAIESEIEQVLAGSGVSFKKLAPERCTGCKRVVRHWAMVAGPSGSEELGCWQCKTPKPK